MSIEINLTTPFAGLYGPVSIAAGAPLYAMTGITVTVFESDGLTAATLYTDRTKATPTGTNTVLTDSNGALYFYADPGIYVLSFTVAGTNTLKTVEVPLDYSGAGPYAIGGDTTATSLPNNTFTQIPIITGTGTTLGYGFTLSSGGLLVPGAGIFACFAEVSANGSPPITAAIWKNGSQMIAGVAGAQGFVPGATSIGAASGLISCAAGDVLQLYGFQVSGSGQTSVNNAAVTFLHVFYEGPA